MARVIGWTLASCFFLAGVALAGDDEKVVRPDNTVEFGNGVGYVEKGKKEAKSVSVVVGQTIRWVNKGDTPQSATSDLKIDGKPLFDTGLLEPGEHKDIPFHIDVYRKAEGKTAGAVTLTYHSEGKSGMKGTLVLISAAKRGGFGR